MYSDTTWNVPCCATVSASFSVEEPLSAVGAPLCELGDDGADGEAEESGAACTKEEKANSALLEDRVEETKKKGSQH